MMCRRFHSVFRLGILFLGCAVGAVACQTTGTSAGRAKFPRAVEHFTPRRDFDVDHYFIDIALFPDEERIQSVCRVRLRPTWDGLEEVQLDLVGLQVTSVTDEDGRELVWTHGDGELVVSLAEPLYDGDSEELVVSYGGTPETGLWFSGERADGSGPNQVFTHGQAEHSRGWFPCFDHPSERATSEVRVTMPRGWVSVAAGEKIDSFSREGSTTEHWSSSDPHPAYLTTLVAGEFILVEEQWEDVPLYYLAEPQYEPWLEASFNETDEILSFFSDYTGVRYPYPKYSQAVVANFPWGGMENLSATTLTPLTLDDERGQRDEQSHRLVAHEAAHQWFGDLLTCEDWSHIWLNEGFATYMTLLYYEHSRGVDEFRARVRDHQDEYLQADRGGSRRPTVWNVYKEPEDLFGKHSYEGAAARLHLLRFLLGDDVFRAGVRAYVADNAGKGVVTDDLQAAMEKVSGLELGWFFDQWLLGKGYPEFGVDWSWNAKKRVVVLDVRQLQGSNDGTRSVFRTPVHIEIRDRTGTSTHRIQITERRQTFELPAQDDPFYVRFDKYGWIPKVMRWSKKPAEWIAIASSDDDVNGRLDAVRALGLLARDARVSNPRAHETYVAEVSNRLRRDESRWVRAAAAQALGVAAGMESRERLIQAVKADEDARVRTAGLRALKAWGESAELAEFAEQVFEEGYSWQTMGAAAELICTADPDGAYLWLTERLFVDSPHDQLCGMLLEHLGGLSNPSVNDQLVRWARDESVHPNARAVAVRELGERANKAPNNALVIAEFLEAEDFRLRQAAVDSLAAAGNSHSKRALKAYYPAAATSRERRAIEGALIGPGL